MLKFIKPTFIFCSDCKQNKPQKNYVHRWVSNLPDPSWKQLNSTDKNPTSTALNPKVDCEYHDAHNELQRTPYKQSWKEIIHFAFWKIKEWMSLINTRFFIQFVMILRKSTFKDFKTCCELCFTFRQMHFSWIPHSPIPKWSNSRDMQTHFFRLLFFH